MNTLIIWEEIPERTHMFLVPRKWWAEHGASIAGAAMRYINIHDTDDALERLSTMIGEPEHAADAFKDVAGLLLPFKIDPSEGVPFEAKIERVLLSGFLL